MIISMKLFTPSFLTFKTYRYLVARKLLIPSYFSTPRNLYETAFVLPDDGVGVAVRPARNPLAKSGYYWRITKAVPGKNFMDGDVHTIRVKNGSKLVMTLDVKC